MKYPYFPGCSLKGYAETLEKSALYVMEKLGVELQEMDEWNCCGVVYPMAEDDIARKLGAVRNMLRAKESGDKLVTVCQMCYNTMKRVEMWMKDGGDGPERALKYLEDEELGEWGDGIEVVHLLELLKSVDMKPVRRTEMKVAPYYGCLLLRPKEVAIDDPEDPMLMEGILERAGFNPVFYPLRNECCGSYHVTAREDLVKERVREIVRSAKLAGAEVMATFCPLCHYNLRRYQDELPVYYFTELLAVALGSDEYMKEER